MGHRTLLPLGEANAQDPPLRLGGAKLRFLGVSENAVRIQIAAALIAYLLLRIAQAAQTSIESPLTPAFAGAGSSPASSEPTSCT